MAMDIIWLVLLGLGWIFFLILTILAVIALKMTPTWTFLKASLGKKALVFVKDRAGYSDFKSADITDYGVINVDGIGTVSIEEGSKCIDKKSKIPIIRMFSEFGVSLPDHFEAAVQEIREIGFNITDFKDYDHIIRLASDELYRDKFLQSIENESERKALTKKLKHLSEIQIKVKPYKSYNINDLSRLFPYNISPVYIDAMVTEETSRRMKKAGLKKDIMLIGAICLGGIMVAGALAWKMVKSGDCHCACEVIRTGVEIVRATNSSLVV